MIAQCLAQMNLTVEKCFGREDIIQVLDEFEGERDVLVMTSDDFLTRCTQIGVPQLDEAQKNCLLKVLGKQELGNAIRLNELAILMQNFVPDFAVQEEENEEEYSRPTSQANGSRHAPSKKSQKKQ